MKKRIISIILAISFLFSLVPAVRAEEKADEPRSIEEQIRAYAESHNHSSAESTAAMALATHGITGGGKLLKFNESSAMTALLLHSAQFQHWLVEGCSATIRTMQKLDMAATEHVRGVCAWYTESKQLGLYAYYNELPECIDFLLFKEEFSGQWNDRDRALEWMVGTSGVELQMTRLETKDDTVVYRVDCTITDDFNFDNASSSGFKEFLSGIGMLMFKEFSWECKLSFTLEVPYSCSHSPANYHWTHDAESKTMASDSADGCTQNEARYTTYVNPVHGTVGTYVTLDKTVRLCHDRPWVVEYQVLDSGLMALTPLEDNLYSSLPAFLHNNGRYIQIGNRENYGIRQENGFNVPKNRDHYCMLDFSTLTPNPYVTRLTYRLENQVLTDGGNRVFLSIMDAEKGTVWVDRIPLDDYYERPTNEENGTLISGESDWLSGQDLYINYIGNQYVNFDPNYFDLRIWENGKDGGSGDYFITKTTEPSCTAPGGTTRTCSKCGYSEQLDYFPTLGHDFTDWQTVKEATCTAEGQMERSCKTCGHRESRPVAVLPHAYTPALTAPNCTDGGFTTYTCECGNSYVADHTDALGHDLTDWAVTNDPTCTDSGVEERWCQRCEHREARMVDPLGHSYEATVVDAQCTVGGYTEYVCFCGDSYRTNFTNPTGHHYEGVVTEPGCTEMGYTTYTCACGDSYKSNFTAPVGHRHEGIVTAPTCTEGGFTTYSCVCGDSYVSNYTNALGHECAEGLCIHCGADDPNYQKPVGNPFTDVPEDSFYFSPVLWAVENGITTGASADSFNPGGECMRAHVVTFLWRAAGSPEPLSSNNPFVDVKESDFYYKAVLWAVENGITNGSDASHFNPFGICNRAQVVTFLYRTFGSPAVENSENPFSDVPTNSWFTAPVLWAVQNGITNGLSADSFGPDAPCNRAQVVTFLHRAYN